MVHRLFKMIKILVQDTTSRPLHMCYQPSIILIRADISIARKLFLLSCHTVS